jgi:glucokinase-like ROK family protein
MAKRALQGSNINLVKHHNLRVVLQSLLYEPDLSRVQLAQRTHLSNTTITNLISQLIEQGIVSEIDNDDHETGKLRSVGRPRTRIHLEPDARYVVGVHIGVGVFRVAVTNLLDEMVVNCMDQFDIHASSSQVMEQMVAAIEATLEDSQVERSKILGVGIGASGLVEVATGINLLAPNLNWHDVPLRNYFQDRLHLPVFVDNNVRAMAMGEAYFGVGRGVDSLAFVYGRVGVGAGLILRGQPFRGSISGAGEIGHNVMLLEGGEPCRCGNSGCLETLVSEPALLRQADKIAERHPNGILAQALQERQDLIPIERVFAAARQGDEEVHQMLEERAYYLGVALAGLVNLFNPEMILLGGIFSSGEEFFLETAGRVTREMAFGGMGRRVHITSSSFGWRAGVLGAAALALMHFFYQAEQPIYSLE